jgi:hypothetical protein
MVCAVITDTIDGLSPREWWQNSLTEGILGTTGLTVDESIDKYWSEDVYLQLGPLVYDRKMLVASVEWQRENGGDVRPRVKHTCFDGEFFAAVHAVEGTNADGADFEVEVLAFGRIANDRIAWLKELYWYPRGERAFADHFADYPLDRPTEIPAHIYDARSREFTEVRGPGLDIDGLAPAVWWAGSLTEGIMGTTGLTIDEALDKYWVPDFYCQSGPPVHLSDRETLTRHLEVCRQDPAAIRSSVQHACYDGEYFAAIHRVGAGSPAYGDWEVEALTFARIKDDRIAWLKELTWQVRGEATSFSNEFEQFPHVAELNAEPRWQY